MDGIIKIAAVIGAGGLGLNAMDAGDLSSVDLSSLNLGMLEDGIDDMREAVRYFREEGVGDVLKLFERIKDIQK